MLCAVLDPLAGPARRPRRLLLPSGLPPPPWCWIGSSGASRIGVQSLATNVLMSMYSQYGQSHPYAFWGSLPL